MSYKSQFKIIKFNFLPYFGESIVIFSFTHKIVFLTRLNTVYLTIWLGTIGATCNSKLWRRHFKFGLVTNIDLNLCQGNQGNVVLDL